MNDGDLLQPAQAAVDTPSEAERHEDNEEVVCHKVAQHATSIAAWAASKLHRVEVAAPSIKKRLVGSSLTLSIDLFGSMCCLASAGRWSGTLVLSRGVVENYARGFWLAHVANEEQIELYANRRYSRTLKNLLILIRKSSHAQKSRLAINEEAHVKILDSLTHGDIGHMLLRNINGDAVGSHKSAPPTSAVLILAAQISVLGVETFVRDVLDDESRSLELFREGQELMGQWGK